MIDLTDAEWLHLLQNYEANVSAGPPLLDDQGTEVYDAENERVALCPDLTTAEILAKLLNAALEQAERRCHVCGADHVAARHHD